LVWLGGSTQYVVKVSDFGLSRSAERGYYKTDDKTIPVKWCAPESIHRGMFSSKSDSWSFGMFEYDAHHTNQRQSNTYHLISDRGCIMGDIQLWLASLSWIEQHGNN
jgi:serine/threonine protein kinase